MKKHKYSVTFYKLNGTKKHYMCTRTRKSTRQFAFKKLFTEGIVFFTIKLSNEKSTKTT